ncbi:MAG: hypothetical protein WC030_01900 [Candidatus Paceibacterota bacterium]
MALNPRKSLVIKKPDLKEAKLLRHASIQEAITWPRGSSQQQRLLHIIWNGEGYDVGVGKPGKEAKEGRALPNSNDMWPFIRKDGAFPVNDASFKDIFREFEHMGRRSEHSLELLGCLLVRSAYMLDHSETSDGIKYFPPNDIIDEIKKEIPMMFGVPLIVFLQYINTISLNEDVKYYTKGMDRGKAYGIGAGRQNNLLTCARLIAVLLKKESIVDFADGFSRNRGVSAMSFNRSKECFPFLNEQIESEE